MSGLLVAGRIVPVPGLTIVNPRDASFARLSSGDYMLRQGRANKCIWHTTKGIWPQRVLPGKGPAGMPKRVADFFFNDPLHSASQFVLGLDGVLLQLGDAALIAAYHATTSNETSVGVEVCQLGDGSIYQAQLDSIRILAPALAEVLDFAHQVCSDDYVEGHIIERLKDGGRDCVGHFGHRDQSWKFPWQMTPEQRVRYPDGYAGRGRGDPGDFVMQAVRDSDAEPLHFGRREDLAVWARRQRKLNELGATLRVDGIAGASTMAAMRRFGFVNGRAIPA